MSDLDVAQAVFDETLSKRDLNVLQAVEADLQRVTVEGVEYVVLSRHKKTGRHGDASPLAWMFVDGGIVWEYADEWVLVKVSST